MSALWPATVRVRGRGGLELVLRGLTRRDGTQWQELRARNREWLSPWEASAPNPGSTLRFRAMVRHLDNEAHDGRGQPFVIERQGRLIGQMQLFGIAWGSSLSASAGYWVSGDEAGQGIAPLALAGLVDHAFLALGLHRIEVNIRPENAASLRVVGKLGFRDEGVRARFLFIDGAWRDHRSFALTREDLGGGSLVQRWNSRPPAG